MESSDPAPKDKPPLIDPQQLPGWVIEEDDDFLVFDKPGWVVCHPSKDGPWSSLVGAVRVWRTMDKMHLVSRLDRETSGVILLAKNATAASLAQTAMERRWVHKTYLTLLEGELSEPTLVDQPLGDDTASEVVVRTTVRPDGSPSATFFEPLLYRHGYTLVKVKPHTGRKHQIRAHALWMGHPVVGDKLYGRDPTLYLEFARQGWTSRLAQSLAHNRQALHAARLDFTAPNFVRTFCAPLAKDLREFAETKMNLSAVELTQLLQHAELT